ncbi:hypothetical protein D3C86_1117870 [compost metagenome]
MSIGIVAIILQGSAAIKAEAGEAAFDHCIDRVGSILQIGFIAIGFIGQFFTPVAAYPALTRCHLFYRAVQGGVIELGHAVGLLPVCWRVELFYAHFGIVLQFSERGGFLCGKGQELHAFAAQGIIYMVLDYIVTIGMGL